MVNRQVLKNQRLEVTIRLPGSQPESERFDSSCVVEQVLLDGKHTFCQPEQKGKQGNRIGIRKAQPLGPVDVLSYAEGKNQVALPVKQPAGLMLQAVLFHIAAPKPAVPGHIQRGKAVQDQKGQRAKQTAGGKQPSGRPGGGKWL